MAELGMILSIFSMRDLTSDVKLSTDSCVARGGGGGDIGEERKTDRPLGTRNEHGDRIKYLCLIDFDVDALKIIRESMRSVEVDKLEVRDIPLHLNMR